MSKVGQAGSCSRSHPWCVREETRVSADGSPARFHLGARRVVAAGDDAVACLLIAPEDLQSELYLEVEVLSGGQRGSTVWLTAPEAAALGAVISASAEFAVETGGSGCTPACSARD